MLEGKQRRATRTAREPSHRRDSGQALLEFALVTPILVLMIMAIFQFAFVIQSQMGLANAVREAARRVAATEPMVAPTWSGSGSLAEWAQVQLCGDATPPCSGGLLHQNVQAFEAVALVTDPPVVTFCSYTVASSTNYRVQVDVGYKHPIFFLPLAFATDLVDGTPNGFWDLSASAQMRLENLENVASITDPGACV
jgi:Flp pilus assembly protein TadG